MSRHLVLRPLLWMDVSVWHFIDKAEKGHGAGNEVAGSHSENTGGRVSSPSLPDPHAVKVLLSDEIANSWMIVTVAMGQSVKAHRTIYQKEWISLDVKKRELKKTNAGWWSTDGLNKCGKSYDISDTVGCGCVGGLVKVQSDRSVPYCGV